MSAPVNGESPVTPVTQAVSQHSPCELLTWKDPVKTGKVFGSIVLALVVFKKVNLFNIFFHLAYIGLLASAAAEYAGKVVTGQGFVTKYKGSTKSYAKYINNDILPHLANFNEEIEGQFQKIVYAHDIETTLKAAGISYVLYKVTSWFSLYTLISIAVVLAFTGPAIYTRNKKEIDAAVAQYTKIAKEKSSEYTQLAQEKAAPHFDALVKKTGPVGAFISSKIPTRTAGSTVGSDKSPSYPGIETEPSTATTTGASKFPEVPSVNPESSASGSGLEEIIDEARAKGEEAQIPTSL
ncbi:hypothetical protein HYPBUDRAFT_115700 [Hyphopichia burtonii NRRL Y-1933]|uniref:Reticulon-like protein n=1 Tax=Hyphopichia burtonii NRRL Y-1933 TaxID=984485 RepID=A0A1E4RBX3_9ASCO|nr:hypothetical protein HYPBUDRAFT_115700 [Hyphopichia burtonii NRRL Y-1933]ODV64736.1 hypothetical protein HYPBUDRAFT_115700 [Hyphopichia burtonii NRRL Y-1933]